MSRARVPCRGSRVTFFFSNFFYFFLEKVIFDAINVIKTNKKNLKNKWRVNIFQLLGGGLEQRKAPGHPNLFSKNYIYNTPETHTTNRTRYLSALNYEFLVLKVFKFLFQLALRKAGTSLRGATVVLYFHQSLNEHRPNYRWSTSG